MGIFGWIIGAGATIYAIKKIRKANNAQAMARAEQERRRNTPCLFIDGFSEYEFERMVKHAANSIRRIKSVTIHGPLVYGVVQSQSGISEWHFTLDFNDYGHITGAYWLSSNNNDSSIPKRLGDMVQSAVRNYSSEGDYEDDFEDKEYDCRNMSNNCPFCGRQQPVSNGQFCVYCGSRLR